MAGKSTIRAALVSVLLICLVQALFGGCESFSCAAKTEKLSAELPQHLIWITADALRADHLKLYGYPIDTAPELERWAKRGLIFERMISHGIRTHISVPGMLFGAAGAERECYFQPVEQDRMKRSLMKILSGRGFKTALWSNHGGPLCEQHFAVTVNDPSLSEYETAQAALSWQIEQAAGRTFLWIHLLAPHGPHQVPRDRLTTFQMQRKKHRLEFNDLPGNLPADEVTNAHNLWAYYDASIGKSDRAIGLFLDGLERIGLLESSLVAVFSDHGEELLALPREDGRVDLSLDHRDWPTKALTHIPLVLLGGGLGAIAPDRVEGAARHIDLAPTFAGAAGVVPADPFEGTDLLRSLRDSRLPDAPAYFTSCTGGVNPCATALEENGLVVWLVQDGQKQTFRYFKLDDRGREIEIPAQELTEAHKKMVDSVMTWTAKNLPGSVDTNEVATPEQKERLRALGYIVE